jgi:hypothetical protein
MNRLKMIIGLLLFSTFTFGQVMLKSEPTKYNYSRGAGRLEFTITNDLCHFLECESQMIRLSDHQDINKYNAADANTTKWQPFYFYEISTINSALIPWTTVRLTDVLSKVDDTHFFGRFNYTASYWHVVPGTVSSWRYQNGLKFIDLENGEFVGTACTGTIIYDDNGYLTISVTTSTPITGYFKFKFSYDIHYYRKNVAKIRFDVPFGYWAWFLKGSGQGDEIKTEIINDGRAEFYLGNDTVPYNFQNRNINVNF